MIVAKMDVSKLVERMQRAREQLPQNLDRELDALAWEAVEDLKRTDSFKDKSGNLRRKFTFVQPAQFVRRVVAGSPSVPYAKYLERGTKSGASRRNEVRAALRSHVGLRVSFGIAASASRWRISPRRFFEHARSIVRRRLKAAMLRAVAQSLRK